MDRIVVGVDASDASVEALGLAAEEARLHGAKLEVVFAFEPPERGVAFPVPPQAGDRSDQRAAQDYAEGQLEQWLHDLDISFEGLDVAHTVVPDQRPSRALIQRSEDADLLVVGSRGRGGFRDLRLGSVSEQLVRHAHCPVLVARRRERR